MKKQTAILFYVLGAYVVLQFAWWAYLLVELTAKINTPDAQLKQFLMIVGEGLVFFSLLIIGLWKIRSSIQKDIEMSKRQNNFLLSVTHELKTPLASNKLNLQTLLKRKTLDRGQQEQLLSQAIEENNRLEEMIENILTATRIENHHFKLHLEECNLSEKMALITNNWAKNRINIQFNIMDNIICKVDLFIMKTVLHNLLENAYKYAGKNAIIEVYLKEEKNLLIWGVKDNGTGIPQKYRKDIFNKFFRIGNEETRGQRGTGLGLYLVKNLLNFHEDVIMYLPNEPTGSHFKITREKTWKNK